MEVVLPRPASPANPDWLVAAIDVRIADGRLPVGAKLPSERELGVQVGLSRPMVREAIGRLVERGSIEVYPGRGAFVRAVGPADALAPLDRLYRRQAITARALVEARAMLEGEAAALAAHRAGPDDHERLRHHLDAFDVATTTQERAAHDLAFHSALVDAAHNPVIATMFASIRRFMWQQLLRSLDDPQVSRAGIPHHGAVAAAIERGDAHAARQAAIGHMEVALRWYGEDLDLPIIELTGYPVIDPPKSSEAP